MARNTVRVSILGDAAGLQRAFGMAEKSSKSFADKFKNDTSILERWAKRGALAIGAIAGAVTGLAVKGGIERLMGLERANKQLKQLGVESKDADKLMERLLDSLRGTPFALDKGAASLAGFVASGRDLRDIPRLIQQVTDVAAFGNTTLEDMDFIWQRIQTTGRVTNEELKMLAERNVPVYTQLAGAFELTAAEVFDMAKNGELSADMFFDAWQKAAEGTIEGTVRIAGAAKSMGDTTEGAWANMRTAMSRFGATLLEDVFPLAKTLFTAIGDGFDRMGAVLKSAFADFDASGFERFIEGIPDMMERAAESILDVWEKTKILRDGATTAFRGIAEVLQQKLLVAIGLVALALKALYAHPVIAGIAAVAWGIGQLAEAADEVKRPVRDLAEEFAELTVEARKLALIEVLGPEKIAALEAAGIAVDDWADGTLSAADALGIIDGLTDDQNAALWEHSNALGELSSNDLPNFIEGQGEATEAVSRNEAALKSADPELRRYEGAQLDLTAATKKTEAATEEATTALEDFENEVRSQTDPLFNLLQKTNELAEAQKATTEGLKGTIEGQKKYKEGSPQHREALRQEYLAWEELKAAQIRVAEQSGLTREAFKTNLRSTRLFTEAEIDLIIADFARINAFKFADKSIRINEVAGTQYSSSIGGRAHGGPVKRGTPYLVGEEGPELMVPDQNGTIVPNGNGGGSALGGSSYSIVVHAGMGADGTEIGRSVVEAIRSYERQNGAAWRSA